jgi:adenine-specific DNA-methyltransferase
MSSSKKTKLELTWIGKDVRPKLEPRILIEDPEKSYHARHRVGDNDIFDNRLIFGDNLLALKALEQEFAGKIKCIYIDPPYNTGSAFEHYDDGVEHSIWLSLVRDRLTILRRLLLPEGIFFCSVDSTELFYVGVLLDELFGRENRLEVIVWKKSYGGGAKSKFIVNQHEFILAYAMNIERNGFPVDSVA